MGYKHWLSRDKIYNTFSMMKQRCNNKNHKGYLRYWWRWIKCEWNNFEEFYKDMYDSFIEHLQKHWKKNTSLDRINNNWNYYKENCRWVTSKEQANNTIKSIKKEIREIMKYYTREIRYRYWKKYIYHNWKWATVKVWCDYLNINYSRVASRVSVCWWTKEEALWFKKKVTVYKNKWIKKW